MDCCKAIIFSIFNSGNEEKLAKRKKDNTYRYDAGSMVYNNDKLLDYLIFEVGMVYKTSTNMYAYEYHLKDHLGNGWVAFQPNDNATTVKQATEYYLFGMNYMPHSPAGSNKYLYNGKEKQDDELNLTPLDWYDYGARFYDVQIGRWHSVDPAADLLESSSPFMYSLNNPINFIDKDGELPIYVNGFVASDSERGNKDYWNAELLNTIRNSGIANPGGTEIFVDGDRGALFNEVLGRYELGTTPLFSIDAENRHIGGKMAAQNDFANILSHLERDPNTGKIIEKIQIYSHSRGGAFSTGYTEALTKMISKYADQFADPAGAIEFILHLAPHQSNSISAVDGVDTYGISRKSDFLSGNDIHGATNFTTNEGGLRTSHQNASFVKDLSAFLSSVSSNKQSTIDEFVRKMREEYNVKVTVQ